MVFLLAVVVQGFVGGRVAERRNHRVPRTLLQAADQIEKNEKNAMKSE
jgi:hypothetical protein